MLGVKIIIYTFIFLTSSGIGLLISKKYEQRVNELKELKNALNMFKTKIKFTYEPIPEIFREISNSLNSKTGMVFEIASENMKLLTAGEAWNSAIDTDILDITGEDKKVIKDLSKLLGLTDIEGQVSQINLTTSLLDEQIRKAEEDKTRNSRMFKTLGMVLGLTIVIILM